MTTLWKRFRQRTDGAFAVWGAMMLPVVVGGAAYAVDLSRLYAMDQDLQSGVDALAKAGAAELDGRLDSMTRARAAIAGLVRNSQKFADGGGQVVVESIRFLHDLPASPEADIGSEFQTTAPEDARYVEVRLQKETVSTVFPPKLFAGLVDVDMDATAVAGRAARVCGLAPLFMCNPVEGSGTSLADALENGSLKGRQVQFKRATGQMGNKKDGNSEWGPGSFGWLDMPGYQGADAMREAIGIDIPDICISTGQTVRLRTGNVNSMHSGFNTRFDMYGGSFNQKKSDPRYAPAANVIKGYSGKGCNTSEDSEALGLPRDSCHESGTCGTGNAGTGDWDFAAYLARNHPGQSPVTIGGVTYTLNADTGQILPSTPPSRYDVYRWEIDTNRIPGPAKYGDTAVSPENGAPQCHLSGPSTSGVDRRIFTAAVLNCQALEANGGMVSGRDLPVTGFVEVFLTEPVGSGSEPTIFGEVVGDALKGIDRLAQERPEVLR